MEGRKQAISIRLSGADMRNLRKLSRRLGARNSDVIRYALKTTLERLAPLHEGDLKGRDLFPVLKDAGADLMRYLDLDASEMEALINEGAPPELHVHRADVQLLAMNSLQQRFARLSLVSSNSTTHEIPDAAAAVLLQPGARS